MRRRARSCRWTLFPLSVPEVFQCKTCESLNNRVENVVASPVAVDRRVSLADVSV